MPAHIIATALDDGHRFSKLVRPSITLLAGLGVEGDAHCGVTVKHRSRVAKDPTTPNLRQVHLIHGELLDELNGRGFIVEPGQLGENVTTRGIDLLSMPEDTVLKLGPDATVRVTGLRNPCYQLDDFQNGLTEAVLDRTGERLIRKSGIMAVVAQGGLVKAGDAIEAIMPAGAHRPLAVV